MVICFYGWKLQSAYTPSGSPSIYPKSFINTDLGFSIVKYTVPSGDYD